MRTNQRSWELGSAASGSDVRSKDSTEECSKLDTPPLILLGTSWYCRMSRDQQSLRGKKKPSDGQEVVVSSCKTSKYKSRSAVSFDPGAISLILGSFQKQTFNFDIPAFPPVHKAWN